MKLNNVEKIFKNTGIAIIDHRTELSYAQLSEEVDKETKILSMAGIVPGSITAFQCSFDHRTIVTFLALFRMRAVLIPITSTIENKRREFIATSEAEYWITRSDDGTLSCEATMTKATHPLLNKIKAENDPGLILFSSGSTGVSKAVLHNMTLLTNKYLSKTIRKIRILAFMLFDHIGGINTYLHTLFTGGTLVIPVSRQPNDICACIEQHQVEILPSSPTFLNMCLLSGIFESYKLPSLKTITYGSEVMMPRTLAGLNTAMPHIKLAQTYGLTEIGILKIKSEASDSLWIKLNSDGIKARVRDGLLEIKTESAMIGYLNAPSPFTEDGWFMTGDAVEVKDDHFRILGRKSEMLNVGGEKVYPCEIENIIQELPGVLEVVVTSDANTLSGRRILAMIRLSTQETPSKFRIRLYQYCSKKLDPYKIPQKIYITDQPLYGDRYKKVRKMSLETYPALVASNTDAT